MANALNSKPMIVSSDITTWRNNAAIVAAGYTTGIRVYKVVLRVADGGVSSAGTVTITAPSDSAELYSPMSVAASTAAKTILFLDEVTNVKGALTWRDFAVTGVTATGTQLELWWDV